MMNTVIRLKYWLNLCKCIPTYFIIWLCNDEYLKKDVMRWRAILHEEVEDTSEMRSIGHFLVTKPEFRNLIIYRLKKKHVLAAGFLSVLWTKMPNLYIYTDQIGGGLFLQHGFSTIINAVSIGENCSIGQQVTIGNNGAFKPVIQDNVTISAGAIVIGNVVLHNSSLIGAGAVVTHDVPENSIVAGVPARVIKQKG